MAFNDCLNSAMEQGEISRDEAARLKGLYEALLASAQADGVNAPSRARAQLVDLLKKEQGEKKRHLLLTVAAQDRIEADLAKGLAFMERPDVSKTVPALLEDFNTLPIPSAEGMRKAIIGEAHSRMEGLLFHFRRGKLAGDWKRHNAADMDKVLDEAFGNGSGSAEAKGFADMWGETAEWLRRRANAAGMNIAKLENWGLPQYHEPAALINAGLDTWKGFIRDRLDWGRMRHPVTELPIRPEERDGILNGIYDQIVTEGWINREPSRQAFGRGMLANQRQEHRFLIFTNAKAWKEYQKDFGQGDVFAAMMGYINGMARDIAHMERFGPNPNATIEWLKQSLTQAGKMAESGKSNNLGGRTGQAAANATEAAIYRMDAMWQSMRGTLNTPVNATLSNTMETLRGFVYSTTMGAAALSSVFGDVGASKISRAFAGLPMTGALREAIKDMKNAGRREAIAAGLLSEEAAHAFRAQARYVGSISGPEWANWLSDRTMTYSGLTPWTVGARNGAGLAIMHKAAELAETPFDRLPPAWKDNFARWGINASDWDRMRAAELHGRQDGGRLLRPAEIAKANPKLASRWNEIIMQEIEYHVPTGSVRARVALNGPARSGTPVGEGIKNFAMLKGFSVHSYLLYTMRFMPMIMSKNGSIRARGAKYAGGLLITLTMMGALTLQAKQIKDGKDPLDMTTPSFWGAAMLQGGGLGLFGDFLFAQLNRFGYGPASSLIGPTGQRLWEGWELVFGNAAEMIFQGGAKNAGREAVKVLGSNTPVLGTVWYTGLAYKRLVLDQLQYLADPKANRAFKDQMRRRLKEYGQEYWWAPGQPMPQRFPNLGAAIGMGGAS